MTNLTNKKVLHTDLKATEIYLQGEKIYDQKGNSIQMFGDDPKRIKACKSGQRFGKVIVVEN